MKNIEPCKVILINNINNQLTSRKLYKEYAFLAYLKKASDSDVIPDFTKRVKEISEKTECSISTLYLKVKALKKLGWVSKNKKDLVIKSWEEVTELVLGSFALDSDGNKVLNKKIVSVRSRKIAEDSILNKVLEYNASFQSEKILEKTEEYNKRVINHLDSFKNLFPKNNKGNLTVLQRIIPYDPSKETRFKHQEIVRINEARKNNQPISDLIEFDKSFSRYYIAKMLGFKSTSTAHAFIQRIKSYGWVKERIRYGVIAKIKGNKFWKIKQKYKNKKGLFFRNNCLIKKMSSVFEFTNEKEHYPIQKNIQGDVYSESYKDKVNKWYDNIIAQKQFLFKTGFNTIDDLFSDIDPERFWGREYCKNDLI